MASRSRLLLVGRSPAPGAGSEAAGDDALAVDVGHHVAVAAEQGLGRAHLRTERQLALGQAVAAVLLEFGGRVIRFRTAGAEGALVHLAAAAEVEIGRASCRERVCQYV